MKYEGKKSSKFKEKRLIKTLVIIFTLVLLSVIGIYYFQSYKVDPQKTSILQTKPTITKPVDTRHRLPDEVTIDKFPADLKEIALKSLALPDLDSPTIYGIPYDLNADGINEWLITGLAISGSGGESYFIYLKKNNEWTNVGYTAVGSIDGIGPSKTNGFYDIFVKSREYEDDKGMGYDFYKYRWNGNKYESGPPSRISDPNI